MANKSRRRSVVIGIIIVALSIGLVFSILPYLQPPEPRFSIGAQQTMLVAGGNSTDPGFNALKLNVTTGGRFYVAISVSGGNASFCPMAYQTYENWAVPYSQYKSPPFPSGSCVQPLTGQITQETFSFLPPSKGTWVVVALNNNPSQISVLFSPA